MKTLLTEETKMLSEEAIIKWYSTKRAYLVKLSRNAAVQPLGNLRNLAISNKNSQISSF